MNHLLRRLPCFSAIAITLELLLGCGGQESESPPKDSSGSAGTIGSTAAATAGSSPTLPTSIAIQGGSGGRPNGVGAGGFPGGSGTVDSGANAAGSPGTHVGGSGVRCAVVGEYHGDCDMFLGWAFDGARCRPVSGCACRPDCDQIFETATACAKSCQAAGQCRSQVFVGSGLGNPLQQGGYCDTVIICAGQSNESDLRTFAPLEGACDPQGECRTGVSCTMAAPRTIDSETWQVACGASLLPIESIRCAVYGP